jgi:hypothetical protein
LEKYDYQYQEVIIYIFLEKYDYQLPKLTEEVIIYISWNYKINNIFLGKDDSQ